METAEALGIWRNTCRRGIIEALDDCAEDRNVWSCFRLRQRHSARSINSIPARRAAAIAKPISLCVNEADAASSSLKRFVPEGLMVGLPSEGLVFAFVSPRLLSIFNSAAAKDAEAVAERRLSSSLVTAVESPASTESVVEEGPTVVGIEADSPVTVTVSGVSSSSREIASPANDSDALRLGVISASEKLCTTEGSSDPTVVREAVDVLREVVDVSDMYDDCGNIGKGLKDTAGTLGSPGISS